MKAYMGLTCKPGTYSEVIKKLVIGLQFDQQNVFLLFGPVDILLQFSDLKNVEEFVEKWFNPIRNIGLEEGLIIKTLSFVSITEESGLKEKPFAFIFMNTTPKSLESVQKKLLAIPEVVLADIVLGPYDIICGVKTEDRETLEPLVGVIQQIPGIESTFTSVVSPIKVMPDW